jgi:hypothetical protein
MVEIRSLSGFQRPDYPKARLKPAKNDTNPKKTQENCGNPKIIH